MSISGLVNTRGDHVTVKRATVTKASDQTSKRTWATQETNVHLLIDEVGTARVQRIFGSEIEATVVANALPDQDIVENDGIIVLDGRFAGDRFRVVVVLRSGTGPRRRVLGLAKTTEAFE